MLRLEEYGALLFCLCFYGEAYAVIVSHLFGRTLATGLHLCHFEGSGQASELIHTRSLRKGLAASIEGGIGHGGLSGRPALGGKGLHGGEHTVMDVLHGNAVACMVVPYGKHAAEDGGIALIEGLVSNDGRRPFVIEEFAVQIVVVVSGGRNDVDIAVGDGHELIALLLHLCRIGIAVVPTVHNHVLRLHGCLAIGMGQCTPNHGLLPETLDITDHTVGKIAELFHHFFFCIRVFVGPDMDALATEYGILAFEVLLQQPFDEGNGLGIAEVEMVHAVLLGTE